MSLRRITLVALVLLFSSTSVLLAEVMDKELSVPGLWGWAVLWMFAGFLATRYRCWLGLITLPVAAFLPAGALSEFYDPQVGPAIVREAGWTYGLHSYAALAVIFLGHVLGFIACLRNAHCRQAT